ncbi:hypothetical protein IW261DRAFT_1431177 [Armillaria novae-zelandiae]|uniref:LysM domain-containing protein n=1 Tax=Armillaria novae-zelandiae TaxID=153914 RepID=A0AA39PV83_9AGAR|nr:hypothetical protein IW261DRAFT_1431177 [Armillaria novae-zelandiae]
MLFTSSFALLLTTILNLGAAQDCAPGRDYTVVADDTCDSICAAHSVSNFQLANANPGLIDADCDNLQPNQVLCLGRVGHDCTETHLVVQGDTCYGITNAEGIELGVFMCNNRNINTDCGNLDTDYVVCVAAEDMGYDPPCTPV